MTRKELLEWELKLFTNRLNDVMNEINKEGYSKWIVTRKDILNGLIKHIQNNYGLVCEITKKEWSRNVIKIKKAV